MALSVRRRGILGRSAVIVAAVGLGTVAPGQIAAHASGGTTSGADLQISGSASGGSQAPGAAYTYTYQVKNAGPQTATAATLTNPLNRGIAVSTATVNGNSAACSLATDSTGLVTVTCNLGDIASGGQVTVVENATAPTVNGTYYDSPFVQSTVTDPNGTNNEFTVAIKVSGTPPLVNGPCATMTVPSQLTVSFVSSTNQAPTVTETMSASVTSCSALTQPNLMVNFVGGPATQPDAAIFTCEAPVPPFGNPTSFSLSPGATVGVTCQTTSSGGAQTGGTGTATLYADCAATGAFGPMSVSSAPNPCTDVLATGTYAWTVFSGIVINNPPSPPNGNGFRRG
jgi:uncharacterized repeat protein (TIGR01451 family)